MKPGSIEQAESGRLRGSTPVLSNTVLVLSVLAWIALVDNLTLWQTIGERMDLATIPGVGFALTLFAALVLILALPLLVFAQGLLVKPLLVVLLLISGALAYFMQAYGIVYDVDMLRNLFETVRDRNTQEGMELLSMPLGVAMLWSTLPPVAFVLWVRRKPRGLVREQLTRLGALAILVALTGILVFANFRDFVYFSRENADLEAKLNPHYTIKSLRKLLKRQYAAKTAPFTPLGEDAVQAKPFLQRIVGVMVVGETARADHWSLNGYARDTNPELSKLPIVNFVDTRACGTSTAYSVPCMFSFLNEADYTPESAASRSNALDVLQTAGVKVVWVDINSSCKGVCARVETDNLVSRGDPASPLWVDGAWQDEILLDSLDKYLDSSDEDLLLVLHTMGSHGPAYYRRVPEAWARFAPYCHSKAPQDCPESETVNAYDNTLLYTDHVLASIARHLKARDDASFMLYASDHGESLGENGIYLHGLPKVMAPKAQTEVPMIAWFSERFAPGRDAPPRPLMDDRAVSHDNLSATLLGLYDVRSDVYDASLDLFPTLPFDADRLAAGAITRGDSP